MVKTQRIWSDEKVVAQLCMLRLRAVAGGNKPYAALLSTVIGRIDPTLA
jgi:hypothetical protein